jgi:hypothetical protein
MSILDNLFGNPATTKLNPHDRQEVAKLTAELIQIGKMDDFLSLSPGGVFDVQCHHRRARDIGKRLNELGGVDLMILTRARIQRKLKATLAEHLDHCWKGVGDWKH